MNNNFRMDLLTIISIIVQGIAIPIFLCTPWMYFSKLGNVYTYSFISSIFELVEYGSFYRLLLIACIISIIFFAIRIIFLFQGKNARGLGIASSILIASVTIIFIIIFQCVFAQLREEQTIENTIWGAANVIVGLFSNHQVELRNLYSLSVFPYITAILGIVGAILECVSAFMSQQYYYHHDINPDTQPDSFDPFEQPAGLPDSSGDSPFF